MCSSKIVKMSDEKFQGWLDELYRELLAPAKTKFVAEVRKRLKNGEVEKVPLNWLDEVERFLDGVNATVFVKEQVRNRHYNYSSVDFALIADMLDVSNIAKGNGGYNWILNILEGNTRYVWSFAIKSKSSLETDKEGNNAIAKAFKDVFDLLIPGHDGSRNYPATAISPTILVVTDEGTEFKGKVSTVIGNYVYASRRFTAPHRKSTELVERFNRTLRGSLARLMNLFDGKWYPYLQQIIGKYNGEKHSATGEAPIDALLKRVLDLQEGISHAVIDLDLPERTFADGSEVRLLVNYDIFAKKSMTPVWSHEVWVVKGFEHSFYIVEGPKGREKRVTEGEMKLVKLPKNVAKRDDADTTQERVDGVKHVRRATKAAKELQILPDSHLAPEKLKLLEGKKRGAAKRAAATLEKVR